MKLIITISAIMIAVCSFGQSESKRWENALYEKSVNNQVIYYFEVTAVNHDFSGINLEQLKNEFFNKEGIIDLKMKNTSQINVYVYSLIDIDVVKSIFVAFDSEINLSTKKVLSLEELENNSVK